MLNRHHVICTHRQLTTAPLCTVLLALCLLAGCAVDVGARAVQPESQLSHKERGAHSEVDLGAFVTRPQPPLPPTTQVFRFPTPTFTPPATVTPESSSTDAALETSPTPYRLATLNRDLAAAYPAALTGERFTLHYDPETSPIIALDELAALVAQILAHHEATLGVTLDGQFDVYAAGALFAAPDQALRGHSFSRLRYFQVVVDNTITSPAQRYIVAHELTHLFAWNTFGVPSSVLLSEGLAVYAGLDFVGNELLSLHDFCAAYAQAGALPRISDDLAYQGHIRNLEHYYAAGCFVKFLIDRHGVAALAQLYPTSDYVGVYGQSLAELEAEWLATTAARPISTAIDPAALVTAVTETKRAYLDLLMEFDGRPEQVDAYRRLDAQWAAVLAGEIPAGVLSEEGTTHE